MSEELARLWISNAVTEERIAEYEVAYIPRKGESLIAAGESWRVIDVHYTYPSVGSVGYNAGGRAPIVDLLVYPGLPFWRSSAGYDHLKEALEDTHD